MICIITISKDRHSVYCLKIVPHTFTLVAVLISLFCVSIFIFSLFVFSVFSLYLPPKELTAALASVCAIALPIPNPKPVLILSPKPGPFTSTVSVFVSFLGILSLD